MLLSVLDQSPIESGSTPADAVHETLELAQAAADRSGYPPLLARRASLQPGLAGASPEVLIAQVAARTSHIRVGSGGVMLQPLQLAQGGRAASACSRRSSPAASTSASGARRAATSSRPARCATARRASGIEHFPRADRRPRRATSTTACPPSHPFARRARHARRARRARRCGSWARATRARCYAAHFGRRLLASPTSSTPTAGPEVTRAYRERFRALAGLARAAQRAWPSSPSARTRRPRRGAWRRAAISSSCGSTRAGPRPTRPSRRRRRYPYNAHELAIAQHAAAAQRWSARPSRCASGCCALAADYAGGRARSSSRITHDSEGAAPLLRAPGRSVRAGAARGDPA